MARGFLLSDFGKKTTSHFCSLTNWQAPPICAKAFNSKGRVWIMFKITLDIEGMACGMCEAHINDAVRQAFPIKKVTSSHSKNSTEIIAAMPIDDEKLKKVIEATGYKVCGIHTQPCERRGFSLFKK